MKAFKNNPQLLNQNMIPLCMSNQNFFNHQSLYIFLCSIIWFFSDILQMICQPPTIANYATSPTFKTKVKYVYGAQYALSYNVQYIKYVP